MKLPGRVAHHWRSHYIVAALLFCGVLPFLPNVNGYFLADDFVLLSWTHVSVPGEALAFFDPGAWWFYRPLVKVFYWLWQGAFGLNPTPYHLASLLLHLVNAFLLYFLLNNLTQGRWFMGLASALFFLLNPHHAETVSWIAPIGDLIAVACILGSLICFQLFAATDRGGYWLGSLGLFALGLMARETTVVLPWLLLLEAAALGFFRPVANRSTKRWVRVGGSYLLVLLTYLLLQLAGRLGGSSRLERGGLQFHPLNVDSILLGVLDYVHGLIPGGSILANQPLEVLRQAVWLEWLFIVVAVGVLARAGQRTLLFGLVWLITTPLLFVFFATPADRYFYLPSIGYAIVMAALLTQVSSFVSKRQPRFAPRRMSGPGVRLAVGTFALGLLVSQTLDLLARCQTWGLAGRTSGGIIRDMRRAIPEADDYSTFYFIGVPPSVKGVPLFGDGLSQAVQLSYDDNRTLSAAMLSCEELQGVQLSSRSYLFEFKGGEVDGGGGLRRLANKQDCR